MLRRFVLERSRDSSGISGTGTVAEGVQFSNGRVAMHWLTPLASYVLFESMAVLETIHGHNGDTTVRWLD